MNLLKCKNFIIISTFNVRTLNTINQIPELIANSINWKIDVVCIQEHRKFHEANELEYKDAGKGWTLITSSATKNDINATIGGVGLLLSPRAIKSLNKIEKINSRIIIANFNGNPETTIISCYSPTNVADEDLVTQFYIELSSLVRDVPKHNLLLIGGDFNAQIGMENNKTFSFHDQTNRNGELFREFAVENRLLVLNTKFQKRMGKLWTFQYANGRKAQLDYLLINHKWKNSCLNCEAYNSFASVISDHRIVSSRIRLSLRANNKKLDNPPPYYWKSLIHDGNNLVRFTIELRNRFDALHDESVIDNPDTTYENFVKAHWEAASNCILLKPKKRKRVPWETQAIQDQRERIKRSATRKNGNPTPQNISKFNREKYKLTRLYQIELETYLQTKIDSIKQYSVNKQSSMVWDTINEISGRKRISQAKLKATSQNDRLNQWKNHFKNLLGNIPNITNVETIELFPAQTESNIKIGPFNDEELNKALTKMKNGKSPGLDGIPPEVWKTKHFNNVLLKWCNEVYEQRPIHYWTRGCILPFPKKKEILERPKTTEE
ncbi:uncharacterized protein [Antedon mediterranea]|uniref:uncharacterized protein n=1 Tax=Antedon mediterranea TaxID=105859 RepID=UPI003AF60B91